MNSARHISVANLELVDSQFLNRPIACFVYLNYSTFASVCVSL